MAKPIGLSSRLADMDARLDHITNSMEQFRARFEQINADMEATVALHNTVLKLLEKLQPLGALPSITATSSSR